LLVRLTLLFRSRCSKSFLCLCSYMSFCMSAVSSCKIVGWRFLGSPEPHHPYSDNIDKKEIFLKPTIYSYQIIKDFSKNDILLPFCQRNFVQSQHYFSNKYPQDQVFPIGNPLLEPVKSLNKIFKCKKLHISSNQFHFLMQLDDFHVWYFEILLEQNYTGYQLFMNIYVSLSFLLFHHPSLLNLLL